MTPSKEQFASFLEDKRFSPLLIPAMSNFTALPYRDADIAHCLTQQIDHSVRWVEIIQYLLQESDPEFKEIGPGRVLTGTLAQIKAVPVPINIRRYY